jgi:hypothetical protein
MPPGLTRPFLCGIGFGRRLFPTQEAETMRTWKLCAGKQGETVLVNVDIVAVMRWVEADQHTELCLGTGELPVLVKQKPEFILNTAPTV